MSRSTIRSYSVIASLALSSVLSFAADKPAITQAASAPPKTEQICQIHPEYSCAEVPTLYGYQSSKHAKEQKAYTRKAKSAEKDGSTRSPNLPEKGELNFRSP